MGAKRVYFNKDYLLARDTVSSDDKDKVERKKSWEGTSRA